MKNPETAFKFHMRMFLTERSRAGFRRSLQHGNIKDRGLGQSELVSCDILRYHKKKHYSVSPWAPTFPIFYATNFRAELIGPELGSLKHEKQCDRSNFRNLPKKRKVTGMMFWVSGD